MMKINFTVNGKDYEAHIGTEWITQKGRDRHVSTVILMSLPERSVNAGACICHPQDDYDRKRGYQIAFKRAVLQRFVVQELAKGKPFYMPVWLKVWHEFRRAFGKALHEQMDEQNIPF